MKRLSVFVMVLLFVAQSVYAQTSAFTFQGRLATSAGPATGTYDLRFTIYDAVSGGTAVSSTITNSTAGVTNGLFTVALDFSGTPFDGAARWLEIGVRTNASTNSYTTLVPRQEITSAPYAVRSANVDASGINGTLSDSQLSSNVPLLNGTSAFTGNVSFNSPVAPFSVVSNTKVNNLNADFFDGLDSTEFWKTGGNAGTGPSDFVGTTDFKPLELRVNGVRAAKFAPTSDTVNRVGIVNVINGSPANGISLGVYGATIAGGGGQNIDGIISGNNVTGDFGTVGGGFLNNSAINATVGGGTFNSSSGTYAVISGGTKNNSPGYAGSVGGGEGNLNGGSHSAISGGLGNYASGTADFIGSGRTNVIITDYSTIGGGAFNTNINSAFSTIGGGFFNIMSGGGKSTISGGYNNTNNGFYATIGGGEININTGSDSTVGGGYGNSVIANGSTVAGGRQNKALGNFSAIAGGFLNNASNTSSTIGGGENNSSTANYATVGGGNFNSANNTYATVPGGYANVAAGQYSLAAGRSAHANHDGSFVWADAQGTAFQSTTSNQFAIRAAGGLAFDASSALRNLVHVGNTPTMGDGAGIFSPNGNLLETNGLMIESFIGGEGSGIFMNGDTLVMWSPGDNDLLRIYDEDLLASPSPTPAFRIDGTANARVAGSVYATAFNTTSDRNAKENFSPVNGRAVLEKICEIPIQSWNFKNDETRHIGPMAQDFYSAFSVGTDEKHIATVDADGVALAAIQGLNEAVKEKDSEIRSLKHENQSLEKRLSQLEQLVESIAHKK